MTSPTSVAVDSRGTIYVGAVSGLLRKPANAEALTPWITPRGGVGQSVEPRALAVDAHNNIYLTADFVPFVQELSPAGALLARFRLPGQAGGECEGCVAVDKTGNVYLTNTAVLTPIEKFSATGKMLASWGTVGAQQCGDAGGSLASDHQGNMYIADAGHNCILKLSPQRKRLAVWGTAGSEPGQFHQPAGVAIDSRGNLYVLDYGNNRIQELPAGH